MVEFIVPTKITIFIVSTLLIQKKIDIEFKKMTKTINMLSFMLSLYCYPLISHIVIMSSFRKFSLISFLSAILLVYSGCSEDSPQKPDNPNNSNNSENPSTPNEKTTIDEELNGIIECLEAAGDASKEIVEALIKNKFVKSATLSAEDSIIDVITQSGEIVCINLAVKREPLVYDEEFEKAIDNAIDDIDSMFEEANSGAPDISTASEIPMGIPSAQLWKNVTSRNNQSNIKTLNKFKILYVGPDLNFHENGIKAAKKIVDGMNNQHKSRPNLFKLDYDDITKYTPKYFEKLNEYDFVIIECHGNKRGQLFFPLSGMDIKQKELYDSLAINSKKSGVFFSISREDPNQNNKKYYHGYNLGGDFIINYFPNLEYTIICTIMCHGASEVSDLRLKCGNNKKILNFFGATKRCTSEVWTLLAKFFSWMAQGNDVISVFRDELEPKGKYDKTLPKSEQGSYYIMTQFRTARYPFARAIGRINRSRSTSLDDNEPILVGAQFRYAVDNNGSPSIQGTGGILLNDTETGEQTRIPMTLGNSTVHKTYAITESFVVNDFAVELIGLKPDHTYIYRSYIQSEENEMFYSPEAFEFTTPSYNIEQNPDVYEIHSLYDWIYLKANYSKYANADIHLMADIDIEDNLYDMNTYYVKLPWKFHGNGHTITYYSDSKDNLWLFPCLSANGVIENLNIVGKIKPNGGVHPLMLQNAGKIENCKFKIESEGKEALFTEYGYIRDNHYSGLINNCEFNITGDYMDISFVYNNSTVTVDGEDKGGKISNCNVKTDITCQRFTGISVNNGSMSIVENCEVSGNINIKDSANNDEYWIGGIVQFNYGVINNCNNTTEAFVNLYQSGQSFIYSGIAQFNHGSINKCINYGEVVINQKLANISNYHNQSGNPGSISTAYGLCARNLQKISDSKFIGKITTNDRHLNGFVGSNEMGSGIAPTITNCTAEGTLTYSCEDERFTENDVCESEVSHIEAVAIYQGSGNLNDEGIITKSTFNNNIVVKPGTCYRIYD